MRLGALILPEYSWQQAQQKWQHAEVLGFDHVWDVMTISHGAHFVTRRGFGAIPTLTAAAMVTERGPFRNDGYLAKFSSSSRVCKRVDHARRHFRMAD